MLVTRRRIENGVYITRDLTGRIIQIDAPVVFGSNFQGGGSIGYPFLVSAVNSGTFAGYTAAAANGGYALATTGAADDDDIDVASPLIFNAAKWMHMEARIAARDIDQCVFNVGFSDTPAGEAADNIAVMHATATLTTNLTDGVIVFASSDSTTNTVRAVSVANDVDSTVLNAGFLPADDEFITVRIVVNPTTLKPSVYINGVLLGETAALRTAVNLCAYFALQTLNGNAEAAFIDYLWAWQTRA